MNPTHNDIDSAYQRLQGASLNELSRLIPRWGIGTCEGACKCEYLVLRAAQHPNAVMLAAGRRLAECLGFDESLISWQPLELDS